MRRYLPAVDSAFAKRRWTTMRATAALAAAIDRMEETAARFGTARDAALAAGAPREAPARDAPAAAGALRGALAETNRALLRVERALTRGEGLRTRSWFRNLIYVADGNNGHANMALPSTHEAIRAKDAA